MTQREQQRINTRKRIYSTAIDLFIKHGYERVKMTDIAREVGMSIGAIYHHFPSKEALIDEGYRFFDEELKEAWNQEGPFEGEDSILFLLQKQVGFCEEHGVAWTSIFFKNQLGIDNTYMLGNERFLEQTLYSSIENMNHTEYDSGEITETLLRVTRGTIYDWCLHKGNYDLQKKVYRDWQIYLKYFGIL